VHNLRFRIRFEDTCECVRIQQLMNICYVCEGYSSKRRVGAVVVTAARETFIGYCDSVKGVHFNSSPRIISQWTSFIQPAYVLYQKCKLITKYSNYSVFEILSAVIFTQFAECTSKDCQ
jgi:hypothetical protein